MLDDDALAARMAEAAQRDMQAARAAGWYGARGFNLDRFARAKSARRATLDKQSRNARMRAAILAQLAHGWQTPPQIADAMPDDLRASPKAVADNIRQMMPEGGIERRRGGPNKPFQYRGTKAHSHAARDAVK